MYVPESKFLLLLENRIHIERVPFSDRGSRLLVYRDTRQPHALYVKLGERLTSVQPGLSTYRSRPPYITDICLVDGDGQPLAFEVTTYPHALVFQTLVGEFVLAFQDIETLSFGVPFGVAAGIRFTVSPHMARHDAIGGEFKTVRNCAYSTNGHVVLNSINDDPSGFEVTMVVDGEEGAAITLNVHGGLELNRRVEDFRATLEAAERRWEAWFERPPDVLPQHRAQYYYAWWVLGNNILAPQGLFRRPTVVPSKAHYIGAWQWDNYFHALALRYVDVPLAVDQILFMIDHQLADGMIPDAVYDEGTITRLEVPVAAAVTKPPLITWVALQIYAEQGDEQMLRTIYDPVVRLNSWWFGMNDDDSDGIVQYSHPFSSGLDDSPLWDVGMPVEAVDINTYLCIQMEGLERIAHILGRPRDAEMWRTKRHALVRRMIEHMYDSKDGLFWNYFDSRPFHVLTPFSLYPLWTGLLPQEINERLVGHLTNPRTFWTTYPLPTVAPRDPKFDGNQMWRGPVWININHIFVEALLRNGFRKEARALTERTMTLVEGQPDIFEYYHPDTGAAPPKAAPIFGWSAACYIDLAVRVSRGEI
jgi:putative isomerase